MLSSGVVLPARSPYTVLMIDVRLMPIISACRIQGRAEERLPLLAELDVDVLLEEAGHLVKGDARGALEGQQVDAEGRVDRVDLAAAHCLNLGVRVGDDLEVDLLQARLLAVPERIRLQRRALTLGVVGQDERTVGDGLAVVAADAVGPDLVEVLARERLRRIDAAEEELPRCIRLLPLERDLLRALVGVAGDLVVAVTADEIVLRIDDLLPRVDEVLVRDGDLLAAPVPVRVRADRVRRASSSSPKPRRRGRLDVLELVVR